MSAERAAAQPAKPKLLIVGPSETKVPGGMATVIQGMHHSAVLSEAFEVSTFASCINGKLPVRLVYTALAYLKFLTCVSKYDVFHIHVASYGSTFRKRLYFNAIKRAGKKTILHLHSGKYIIFYEGLNAKKQAKMVSFLQSADLVVALSDEWKAKFEQIFGLTNCVTVHNGVDTAHFAQARCEMSGVANEFLFLGRLSEAKGIYDLVEAMAKVKALEEHTAQQADAAQGVSEVQGTREAQGAKLHCVLAGVGDTVQVKALVAQHGLEDYFEFAGWIDDAQKMARLSACAALVLPSHGEALPMAVLEAMAAGKAVVATAVGAIPEVVQPENGVLFAPKDTDALAAAMMQVAGDAAFLEAAAEHNTAKVEQYFSQTAMHTQLRDYLLALV